MMVVVMMLVVMMEISISLFIEGSLAVAGELICLNLLAGWIELSLTFSLHTPIVPSNLTIQYKPDTSTSLSAILTCLIQ